MLLAEADMDSSSSRAASGKGASSSSPASKGDGAFNTLAKFIFGGNAAGVRMQMTTPVFTDDQGSMQFVIEPSYQVSIGCQTLLLRHTSMSSITHGDHTHAPAAQHKLRPSQLCDVQLDKARYASCQ